MHRKGHQVRLPPRIALSLAVAFQELATNTVKYGARSTACGEVRVAWSAILQEMERWEDQHGQDAA
ncbi:sensor histidine kinase [Microvirga sp. KLBC 81]|uniref:sensor histidine kinase n=1 Tax=Microvirga sp. KLBC 81 TaxID=1862707 RepID=UPI001403B574|nr:sensor histidine kinase [Microvirga sp. KLBC 81]